LFAKKNIGTIDRALRVILASVVGVLYFTDQIAGTTALILGLFAVVFLVTGLMGHRPLYKPFTISTAKKQSS
jgi:glucose uptake protein GlcU